MKTQYTTRLSTLLVTGLWMVFAGLPDNAMADKDKTGDVARGATAWVQNCVRCHNVRDPKELRDDQWITTTFHMRIRAGLTGQQTRDIITYLQASN